MYISFIDKKIQKLCEDHQLAQRKLGDKNAKKLFQRIAEIRAAENLADLRQIPGPRCHPLTNNRQGQYALDLLHPKRLIILPHYEKELIERLITDVVIIEVIDYH